MDVASFIGTIIWFISSYVGYLLYKRYRGFQLFREMGVPGPKPHFISGNMNELKHGTKSPATTGLRWQNQFGKVYGYFRGTLPT